MLLVQDRICRSERSALKFLESNDDFRAMYFWHDDFRGHQIKMSHIRMRRLHSRLKVNGDENFKAILRPDTVSARSLRRQRKQFHSCLCRERERKRERNRDRDRHTWFRNIFFVWDDPKEPWIFINAACEFQGYRQTWRQSYLADI